MNVKHYRPDEAVRLREKAGLTPAEVAERMGSYRMAVHRIENGGHFSYGKLCDYAKAINVPVTLLLEANPQVSQK